MQSDLTGIAGLLFGLFFSAVLPGLCEEVTHRGMLLNGLRNKVGLRRALIISSVMFGLMHLNVVQFFYATCLGFIMGVMVIATRSIWPAVIMHFTNNAIVQYLSVANEKGWLFGNFFEALNKMLGGLPFGIIFVVLFAFVMGRIIMQVATRMMKICKTDTADIIEIFTPSKKVKFTATEGLFYYGVLFFGITVTIFTFMWGLF